MIKDYLEDLKTNDNLKNRVLDYYIDMEYDSFDDLLNDMEDLQSYGCISGMIGDLIYYEDTKRFYNDYKQEINDMVANQMRNTGLSMEELFGDKYDKYDPLILDVSNQNLLAWFGFEETAYNLYENIKDKIRDNENDYEY